MYGKACLLCVSFLASECAFAQQPDCSVTLPVTVFLPDGTLVRNLNKDQFIVQNKQVSQPIGSYSVDSNSRRVVFVVETGKQVTAAARQIESAVVTKMLADARPADSFALLTAHGPSEEVRFSESRDKLEESVRALGDAPRGRNQGNGVLDSVQHAIDWLQPPQVGDSIVVLTMGIEKRFSQVGFRKIREELTSADIRVFGFQLGPDIAGFYSVALDPLPGGPGFIPRAYASPNEESLSSLSYASGGFVFVEDTDNPRQSYKLTDERLKVLRHGSGQVYKAIREFYVLTLQNPPKDFEVNVADTVRTKLPKVLLTYPSKKDSCR